MDIGPAVNDPGAVGLAIKTSGISAVPNTTSITPTRLALEMQ